MQDYYEILQVHPKADDETIRAAYERLMARYDAAKLEGAAEELVEMARTKREQVERAYGVLSNADQRVIYDEGLQTQQQTSVAAALPLSDTEHELDDSDLIDYRPLPPARCQERPRDFNTQPLFSPDYAARHKRTKPSLVWRSPVIMAFILTFTVGVISLLLTEGMVMPSRIMPVDTAQQNPTASSENPHQQQMPSADDLTAQFEGQIVSARQVVKEVPDNPNAWSNLGNVLYDSVEVVREHMPDSPAYQELLPRWLEASEAYSKALELNPDDAVVRADFAISLCNYGVGIDDQSYVVQGLTQARQAKQQDPEKARVLLNLGACLVSIKPPQTQEALENWRKVLLLPDTEHGVLVRTQQLLAQYSNS